MPETTDSEIQRLFKEAEAKAEEWGMPEDSSGADMENVDDDYMNSLNSDEEEVEESAQASKEVSTEAPKEEEKKVEAEEKKDDDSGGILDQDSIADLVAQTQAAKESQEAAKSAEEPAESPAEEDSGGVMSQDQIDSLVADAKNKPTEEEPESDDDKAFMSQDEIGDLVSKVQAEKAEAEESVAAQEAPSEQPAEGEGAGAGVMTQAEIEAMMGLGGDAAPAQEEAPAEAVETAEAPQAAPEEPPAQEPQAMEEAPAPQPQAAAPPAAEEIQPTASGDGLMNQDEIAQLIERQKQEQKKKAQSFNDDDIAALFNSAAGGAPPANQMNGQVQQPTPEQKQAMWDSKVTNVPPPAGNVQAPPGSAIPPEELQALLQPGAKPPAQAAPSDGVLNQDQIQAMLQQGSPVQAAQANAPAAGMGMGSAGGSPGLADLISKTDAISKTLGVAPEENPAPPMHQGSNQTQGQMAQNPQADTQFQVPPPPPKTDKDGRIPLGKGSNKAPVESKKSKTKILGMAAAVLILLGGGGYYFLGMTGQNLKNLENPSMAWEWEANENKKSSAKFRVYPPKSSIIVSHISKASAKDLEKINADLIKAAYEKRKSAGKIKDFVPKQEVRYLRAPGVNDLKMYQFDYAFQNLSDQAIIKKTVYFPHEEGLYKLDFTTTAESLDSPSDGEDWIRLDNIFKQVFGLSESPKKNQAYLNQDNSAFEKASRFFANKANPPKETPETN